MKHFILFLALFFVNQAFSQSKSAAEVLQSTDQFLSTLHNARYEVGYCFKSASKTDTSSQTEQVMIFENGAYPNDTLKSFIINYANGRNIEAFDGRYFYVVNHLIKTIETVDIAALGIKNGMKGTASDFVYLPFLSKKTQHFLPRYYEQSIVRDASDRTHFAVLENVDSVKNDWKISAFDPEYRTIKIQLEISPKNGALKTVRRWITFMTTPQYEETYFSDFEPLPDTSSFNTHFDLNKYIQLDYRDYKAFVEEQRGKRTDIAVKKDETFPAFALQDVNGIKYYSDSLKSGLILLDFWYRSCYPCLKAMTALESLHQKYGGQGLLVLGINPKDPSANELKSFLTTRNIHYNSLLDDQGVFAKQLNITGYPALFLIDAASKKVLFIQRGYSDETEATLEALIKTQLGIK